jgi:hypothetical protein
MLAKSIAYPLLTTKNDAAFWCAKTGFSGFFGAIAAFCLMLSLSASGLLSAEK